MNWVFFIMKMSQIVLRDQELELFSTMKVMTLFPLQVNAKSTEAQRRAKERAADAKKIQDLERQVGYAWLKNSL